MKTILTLFCSVLATLSAFAGVKISDLTQTTSPSTNTWIEVQDVNAATQSGKYLLTNLVTQSTLQSYAQLADPTFTGTVTMDTLDVTTLTATNWLLPVAETNKVLGIGISTNPVPATSAMVQNTIGANVYQAYDDDLTPLASGITGLVKGAGNGGGYSAASAGTDYTSPSSTEAFSNKTFDAAGTGNVLKQTKYIYIGQAWRLVDGAGCVVPNTNNLSAAYFMTPQFSGTGASNANYVRFSIPVPPDIDTSVDLTATVQIVLSGADTAAHDYHLGMVSIANSAAAAGTPANFVSIPISADGSGASGDVETSAATTLTAWKSNVTAGQFWLIELRRNGADDSTVASYLKNLTIAYGSTL